MAGRATTRISGGAGDDTINGGIGTDTLTGDIGRDIFFFNSAFSKLSLTSIDKINDFSVLDDTIQLENAVFTELAPFAARCQRGPFSSARRRTTATTVSSTIPRPGH